MDTRLIHMCALKHAVLLNKDKFFFWLFIQNKEYFVSIWIG